MARKKKAEAKSISNGLKWAALDGKKLKAAQGHAAEGKTALQISDYFRVNLEWVEQTLMPPEPPPPGADPVAVAVATPNSGPVPLTVSLDGTGSTGEGLTFEWFTPADQPFSTDPVAESTLHVEGVMDYKLVVTDANQKTSEALVTVTVTAAGEAPTASASTKTK